MISLTVLIGVFGLQPRSQGLSSLPPLVVGIKNDQGRKRRETLGTRLFGLMSSFLRVLVFVTPCQDWSGRLP